MKLLPVLVALFVLGVVGLAYQEGRRNERLRLEGLHLAGQIVQHRKQETFLANTIRIGDANELLWVERWSDEQLKSERLLRQLGECRRTLLNRPVPRVLATR